ncbi:MAG: N-acetyltransferase family protein [Haloferacaceae archaeon]
MDVAIRDGRERDAARVREIATDTWPDRAVEDYVGGAYPRWVTEAESRDDRRVLVADRDGEVVAVMRGLLLSDDEGWASGLRVAREARGAGVGKRLTRETLDWLRGSGATVCRNLVHGWNAPSLALSRATGFEPLTAFRFAEPTPDAAAGGDADLAVVDDAGAALAFWSACETRERLAGLALDPTETWAFSTLTRGRVRTAAEEGRLFAVRREEGVCGLTLRTRVATYGDGDRIAEYGVGAWPPGDAATAQGVLAAAARDAADVDADRARVVVPERVTWATDAASAGAGLADGPEFVLAADLSGGGEAQTT